MAEQSMYSRGGSGMTTGGLDDYLGPQAKDFSNLPAHIEDAVDDQETPKPDCTGADADEPVCQIAEAERQADIASNH